MSEWHEIKEARKAIDSAASRMDGMQREREEYFQDRRRFREALVHIAVLVPQAAAEHAARIAAEALRGVENG